MTEPDRVSQLLDDLLQERRSSNAAAMRSYRQRNPNYREKWGKTDRAKRRAYRRVALGHPEELARVLKQELRREGL